MLLALAAGPDGDVAKLLGEAGLDYHRLAAALRDERRRTLAFAGMKVPDTKLVATTELDGSLTFGTSAKAAIRRALVGARHERHRRHRSGRDGVSRLGIQGMRPPWRASGDKDGTY